MLIPRRGYPPIVVLVSLFVGLFIGPRVIRAWSAFWDVPAVATGPAGPVSAPASTIAPREAHEQPAATPSRRRVPVVSNIEQSPWRPTGLMPNGAGVLVQEDCKIASRGGHCTRLSFNLTDPGWRGVYWLASDFDNSRPGPNLYELLGVTAPNTTCVRLVGYARSPGSACFQLKVGGAGNRGYYADSLEYPVATEWITFGPAWEKFSLDLGPNRNLSCIQGGFCVVANDRHNADARVELFLADVYFETYDEIAP